MGPGNFVKDPISAISFGMALMFGTAGLPHILMRFFTVPSAKEARKSVMWATGWIGYFYLLTFIIGFGAITFVLTNPQFLDAKGGLLGGGNMAAVHLANAVGGNVFLGFISAVAFATILAVVAGLTLSGASAVSHDLYATVVKKGKADSAAELRVSRITTVVLGIVAVALGIVFEKQNIAFMVSLAFAIAASANFPVLFMSVLWKDCTTRGAVVGGFLGLVSSVVLTVVSPSVWEATLGNPKGSALFPYASPALFSMTIGFVGIWLFSILDSQRARQASTATASWRSRCARKPASARRARAGIDARAVDSDGEPSTCAVDLPVAVDGSSSTPPASASALAGDRAVRDAMRKPFYVDGATWSSRVPAAVAAGPDRRAGARRRRAWASSRPPTCATRCCAPSRPPRSPVREVARFDLVEVARRGRPVRGAVADGAPSRAPPAGARRRARVLGVLGQLDLVGFVANHSHIVALQIDAGRQRRRAGRPRPRASTRWSRCCTRAASGSSASRASSAS